MTIDRELLRLAGVLARTSGGPRGYTHVGRNRAISTAYQAVFHRLARLCAEELAGLRPSRDAYEHIYRSLEHSVAKVVFQDFSRQPLQTKHPDVNAVGRIFIDLQTRRHKADYDPFYYVNVRGEIDVVLADAENALDKIGELSLADRRLLAARLIGRPRRSG